MIYYLWSGDAHVEVEAPHEQSATETFVQECLRYNYNLAAQVALSLVGFDPDDPDLRLAPTPELFKEFGIDLDPLPPNG